MKVDEELLRQRIVMLGRSIDEEVANVIIAQLLFLQSEDGRAPIRLVLASVGGRVADSLAIYDVMSELTCPIQTHCTGNASGTAALLLAAGTRGERSAAPSARVVFTPITIATREVTDKVRREVQRTEGLIGELLAKATGQPREHITDDLRAGRVFDTDAAVAYGLVDRVA